MRHPCFYIEVFICKNEAFDIEKEGLPNKNNRLTGGFCTPVSKPLHDGAAFRNQSIVIVKQRWIAKRNEAIRCA